MRCEAVEEISVNDNTNGEGGRINYRWVRRNDARAVYGIGKDILDKWACEGKVEAHKLHPGKNGTVVFSADDISAAIRSSPQFIPVVRG